MSTGLARPHGAQRSAPADRGRLRGVGSGPRLWRTSTFRLTTLFGLLFAAAVVLVLGLVYWRTADYLTRRVDHALAREVALFREAGPESILHRFDQEAARDPLNSFGLFSQAGDKVAGDTRLQPSQLRSYGEAENLHGRGAPPSRAEKALLPWGETLIVERDTSQIAELRQIILGALVWTGAGIAGLGYLCGLLLSLRPLRRVQAFQEAGEAVASGDFSHRLPVEGRRDELDQLALIANGMLDEIERLVEQARTVGESVAHELRTPLTRLRASLDHARQTYDDPGDPRAALLERCVSETEGLLARFQALLRIAAVEARSRGEEIAPASLGQIVTAVGELYQPLAAERGIDLRTAVERDLVARADADLLFEAVSNLVDNAIKFTPSGGLVELSLNGLEGRTTITVRDNGPGISDEEKPLVVKRFYRSTRQATAPGHGLGLSLVAAVADLHGFELRITDGHPGATISLIGGA